MKIENTEIYGYRRALYGMRNPKNSWAKSDSVFWAEDLGGTGGVSVSEILYCGAYFTPEYPVIGEEDSKLMLSLVKAGGDHRKFLRFIIVTTDLTLPRYVWAELDTYKVGTVRNSCSTMHKLGSRSLGPEDFQGEQVLPSVLTELNTLGEMYRNFLSQKDSDSAVVTLRTLKRHLPEGFLQKATYQMNYEVALRIYLARYNHRMEEWSAKDGICDWIRKMPYMEGIIEACKGAK